MPERNQLLMARFALAARSAGERELPDAPLGVPWFRPEDYARICETAADRHRLPFSFEQWRQETESRFKELVASGCPLQKVVVDPEAFLAFCEREELRPDATARNLYAAVTLARRGGTH